MGLNLTINKNVLFRGWEQHLDHAAPVESGSPLPGASPISESVQKVVLKTLEICDLREKHVFVGLRSSPSFFYTKKHSKSTSQDPLGRSLFNFFGRWICTRYSEIVTFPIWGSSGRRVGRARAGTFSGTLARPFFAKPRGDVDGNPLHFLTIPFWSLFENLSFLRKTTRFGRLPFGRFGEVNLLSVKWNINSFDVGAFQNRAFLSRPPEEAEKWK